ncbi:hypothetical protein D1816_11160 [Aquimarina sp. AD10]|uniref:hypothetical protein n=1 Tax=Aquimarina sp. AD10 TaxID=1714849 RepID=UPI000E494D14|nr:hypothetical protein [Aquimarina sp. AD10]AXT60880.1 hypothetical protein D1816_11160 [Aquimarina sp. AD10]RKM93043.1 hypothetical protein D7033_20285 [Aquimarina sp. AD10]
MKKLAYCLLVFISLVNNTIMAQSIESDNNPRNIIYINAGTLLVYNSVNLNYERRTWHSDNGFFKNYYLNLGAGIFSRNSGFAPGPNSKGIVSSLGLIALTGKSNGHFETGLGVSVNIETDITNDDPEEGFEKETFVLPNIIIGYRYQKENAPMIRLGIDFPRGIYMGFGYGF